MEWDRGAPWYRPTRVNHVPAGAEMGWRSGWSKWPDYYLDSLPAAVDIGPHVSVTLPSALLTPSALLLPS